MPVPAKFGISFDLHIAVGGMLHGMVRKEALGRPLAAPTKDTVCRACGGAVSPAFQAVIMGEVPVTYHRCGNCRSLMLLEPHWLSRAYSRVIIPDPDFGALRRTLFVHRFLRRLRSVGILPRSYRCLDFGSGLGMLVRLQRDQDLDAWGYDLYATPKFAEAYCAPEMPEGNFDLITCIEVLEHTTNPVEVLKSFRSRVKNTGIVVVSTELVDGQLDPKRWHYLALEHGQHVTLFSKAGLGAAVDAAGFDWIRSFSLDQHVPFLHLLVSKRSKLSSFKLLRLRLQQWLGESNYASDARI